MKDLKEALTTSVIRTEDDYIFVEPVCNFFGIYYRNQLRKIKEDPICQTDSLKKSCQSAFGDKKKRFCVGKRAFIRWIQIINVQIVHTNLQDLFQQYQVAVFDFLYHGSEARNQQLEDICRYAININNAIRVKNHIMEYVGEQKNHRDICLVTPPEEWVHVRLSLTQTKQIPEGTEMMKALNPLPANMGQLKLMKKNAQTNILKLKNLLKYQKKTKQPVENPMPDGYRREKLKLMIAEYERKIEDIDFQMLNLLKEREG